MLRSNTPHIRGLRSNPLINKGNRGFAPSPYPGWAFGPDPYPRAQRALVGRSPPLPPILGPASVALGRSGPPLEPTFLPRPHSDTRKFSEFAIAKSNMHTPTSDSKRGKSLISLRLRTIIPRYPLILCNIPANIHYSHGNSLIYCCVPRQAIRYLGEAAPQA